MSDNSETAIEQEQQAAETSRPPHALPLDQVTRRFEVNPQKGLSAEETETRRERHGANRLAEAEQRSAWRILLDQFKSIVIVILLVAAALAFATARWPEGIALVAVTVVNTVIGFVSEWKAVRSMEALRKLGKHRSRVRRGGEELEVDAEQLVPGDIVLLGAEELVPADIRVSLAEQLRINEAALTGESVPVHKTPEEVAEDAPLAERFSMLYKGTTVTEGRGEGVVVATGMQTELGRISELAGQAEEQATPLQQKLDRLGRRLAWITLAIAALVAVVGIAAQRDMVEMIETSIALGAAAIPEGLPIVATIALARGMWLMAKRNALVNRLTAVETLGATRVIFTDKTGTLTENRMTVSEIVTPVAEHQLFDSSTGDSSDGRDGAPPDARNSDDPLLERLVRNAVLCNNATLGDSDDEPDRGDPTEIALLEAGLRFDMPRGKLLETLPEVREESFDPDVMMMATFHEEEEAEQASQKSGRLLVAVKGAPRAVLEVCCRSAQSEGHQELDEDGRHGWLRRADKLAADGLRLLAVAEKHVEAEEAEPYEDLTFLGLIGLFDPPREEVRDAIRECQRAGMRVVMVTGDRPDTGAAIGERVGLEHDGSALHGSELEDLENLSPERRREILDTRVFARVTPEQKLSLVKLYQDEGEIVAMTGDGVNDAPALKQADIGVAMGKRGTDAARQMADMVLRDDEFSTIVAAVRQGRIIFANIRKSVMFMLCTNVAEIMVVAFAALVHIPMPLLPLQILFLNVLTDVFPALALGVGKGSAQVMNQPPRAAHVPVLTRHHWVAIGAWSLIIGTCVLAALGLALQWLGFEQTRAVTVSFLTLGFAKLWFVLNLRDRGTPAWRNDVVRNPWIGGALVFCSGLLLLAVYWSPLSHVLDTAPPGWDGWLLILGMSLVPALLGLVAPGIRFHASRRPAESRHGSEEDSEEDSEKDSERDSERDSDQ